MSHDDTNTSTLAQRNLSDIKKERRQFEQDALLLSNRIKLLQVEEAKTWRQIQETQKKQAAVQEARRIKEENSKLKEEVSKIFEKKREANQKKIKELKFSIEKNKQKNILELQTAKRHAYLEVRNLRDKSIQQKYQFSEEVASENKKRSKSVKIDHIKQAIRAKKLNEAKRNVAKEDYMKRINEEFTAKAQLEAKVTEMEILENELIKKLQNTQNLQQKVICDLESLKRKPTSSFKY